MKVGDGTNRFDDLQWISAKAADVNSYAKLSSATFETQIKSLASAELSQSIKNNADAIDALEALVGSETVTKQIADAITALDLANTYAAKEHTHTKDEITDFLIRILLLKLQILILQLKVIIMQRKVN